jgi:hypothetical protein
VGRDADDGANDLWSVPIVPGVVLRLAIEIIDSMSVVVVSVAASAPPTPRRRTASMSSSPSRNDAAASGWSDSSSWARRLVAS